MKSMLTMNENLTSKASFSRQSASRSIPNSDQGEQLEGIKMEGKIIKNLMVLGLVGALMVSVALGQDQIKNKEVEKDLLFTGLTLSLAGLNAYETYQTINAYEIANNRPDFTFRELNPVMRSLIDNKPLLIGIKVAENIGTTYLLKELRKNNKALAYIAVIGLNIVRGYFVYHNYQQSKKFLLDGR
ncbi:MAG: hypothetical protein ACETWC_08730 [Acidobacteriota bacterium]